MENIFEVLKKAMPHRICDTKIGQPREFCVNRNPFCQETASETVFCGANYGALTALAHPTSGRRYAVCARSVNTASSARKSYGQGRIRRFGGLETLRSTEPEPCPNFDTGPSNARQFSCWPDTAFSAGNRRW